jgi:hypothetical protein
MIIGLCGYARSGKDEFYKAVSGTYTRKLAFATRVKQEVQDFLNVHFPGKFDVINNDADKIFWRKLLVDWGDTCRKVDPNIWIDKLKADNASILPDNSIVKYITDVRYFNEAQWVLDNNGILIMIKRADVFADNDVEDETIGDIIARLKDKYFKIFNKGDDLDTYHAACRCFISDISQGKIIC